MANMWVSVKEVLCIVGEELKGRIEMIATFVGVFLALGVEVFMFARIYYSKRFYERLMREGMVVQAHVVNLRKCSSRGVTYYHYLEYEYECDENTYSHEQLVGKFYYERCEVGDAITIRCLPDHVATSCIEGENAEMGRRIFESIIVSAIILMLYASTTR